MKHHENTTVSSITKTTHTQKIFQTSRPTSAKNALANATILSTSKTSLEQK